MKAWVVVPCIVGMFLSVTMLITAALPPHFPFWFVVALVVVFIGCGYMLVCYIREPGIDGWDRRHGVLEYKTTGHYRRNRFRLVKSLFGHVP